MIKETIKKLINEEGMSIPQDYLNFIESYHDDDEELALPEIDFDERTIILSGFLGATGQLETDLYLWYKFAFDGSEYLGIACGVFGENVAIKVKGDKIGHVVAFFDDDEEMQMCIIADSFSEFLTMLRYD